MRTVQIRAYGQVQNVGFRMAAQEKAKALGLSGWVANQSDGSVEILASGGSHDVGQLISWVHQGPDSAEVHRVDITEIASSESVGGGFEIRESSS